MTDPMLRKLARQLVSVDKRVRDLETVPQLAHSSIDDGALPVYDAEGALVAKVGKQDDGTWGAPPLQGPTPPAPRGVTATGGPGTINVAWTGEFVRDAAPLDFDTLEVLVDGVLAGAIPNRDGGTVSISAEQGYRFVAARIRTLVPRHSATTSPFSVEVGPPADQLFIEAGERIEAAEGQIQQGKDDLEAERLAREAALADAAQNLQDLADELAAMPSSAELEAIRGEVATAQQAVEAAQADATAAKTAADNASSEAATAQQTADDAAASALAAAGIAADKGRIFYQTTEPTGDDRSPNNLWIDSDDGRVYVWNGSAWEESQSEDLRDAAQAAVAAQQAAEAADSKAQAAAAAAAAADAKAAAADQKAQDAADAAAAAQQTADDATLDARTAHNEAVSAQEAVQAALDRGDNLILNGSFELDTPAWPRVAGRYGVAEHSGAHTGARVMRLTPVNANAYPMSNLIAVQVGQQIHVQLWYRYFPDDRQSRLCIYFRQYDRDGVQTASGYGLDDSGAIKLYYADDLVEGEWTLFTATIPITKPGTVSLEVSPHALSASTDLFHIDDFQAIDVTAVRAAQAAADAAQELAASKPGMDEVNQAIVVSANGKNAITVSADAPTASTPGAVVGDTWWRVDGSGDIFGQWSWTGSAWAARTVTSEVIANLDVGKLTVTGTSRFTTAVVDRLFADIFTAHKITANELTIAALDENGEIKPDSVEAVMIKDGQISANKILLLGDPNDPDEAALVATIASIMKLAVENLVVTEGATISAAVIEKLAAQMITSGVLQTAESGQRVVIDASGIVMYSGEVDDAGAPLELVRIGPSGENLITIGESTISSDSVAAPRGVFSDSLSVGGSDILDLLTPLPRGIVAWGQLTDNSGPDSSKTPRRRAELQTKLQGGRLYRGVVSGHYLRVSSGTAATNVEEFIHASWDMTPIFPHDIKPGVYQQASSRVLLNHSNNYYAPGMEFFINADGFTGERHFWAMFSIANTHEGYPVNLVAGGTYPLLMYIEDLGPSQAPILKRWNDNNGGGEPETGNPVQRTTTTWNASGYGGDTSAGDVVQGYYSGVGMRYGGWTFPSSMVSALSGSTVEKFEVYLYATHWYWGSGGTASLRPNNGGYKGTVFGGTQATSANWPRGAGRWVTLPSSWYPSFANGTYKGISVQTASTNTLYYGRFRGNAARFRVTYRK